MIRSQLCRKLRFLSTPQCYSLRRQACSRQYQRGLTSLAAIIPPLSFDQELASATKRRVRFATSTQDLENLEPLAPHGGSSFAGRVLGISRRNLGSLISIVGTILRASCQSNMTPRWSHAGGLRTLLVANWHIYMYINMAGHALWGVHRLYGLI
jgi:hypothetical protein